MRGPKAGVCGSIKWIMHFDCNDFPMIKPSETGKTVASLSLIIRVNEKQLHLHNAEKLSVVEKAYVLFPSHSCARA
jgi:hypothetical protein